MRLQLGIGTPYQFVDGLFESTDLQTSDQLQPWADTGCFFEISCKEAIDWGVKELAEWLYTDSEVLFLIDDVLLVVQNRQCLLAFNDN